MDLAAESQRDFTERALKNVHPGWLEFFGDSWSVEELRRIGVRIRRSAENIVPPVENIFQAFKFFPPAKTRVVIFGQDPYPTPGDAMGLAFSVNRSVKVPPSLVNIFAALRNHGLAPDVECDGDLTHWALQGILMLNTSLTTVKHKSKEHTIIWSRFVQRLVSFINNVDTDIIFMLWGGDAKGNRRLIDNERHTVMEWTHPSPMIDRRLPAAEKFRMCDHFTRAGRIIKEKYGANVSWFSRSPVFVFTDGSCKRNGKPGASAQFASIIASGTAEKTRISGPVPPYEMLLRKHEELSAIMWPNECYAISENGKTRIAPTNQRAEILAVCWGLLAVHCIGERGVINVVSDSKTTIDTLTKWIHARRRNGTEHELANLDLLNIAFRLIEEIKRRDGSVKFHHVAAHMSISEELPPRERFFRLGNSRANDLAGLASDRVVLNTNVELLNLLLG